MLFAKFNDGVYLLNPIAGFIWMCCDGKTDVKAIRKALQGIFVDNKDEIARDLLNILELWQNQGLIYFEVQLINSNLKVAYLIIAHHQPAHLAKLIEALNCE